MLLRQRCDGHQCMLTPLGECTAGHPHVICSWGGRGKENLQTRPAQLPRHMIAAQATAPANAQIVSEANPAGKCESVVLT
jgi:hypothetical protein